jgi:hypothetical protein
MKIKNELERQREIEEMRMDKWRTRHGAFVLRALW